MHRFKWWYDFVRNTCILFLYDEDDTFCLVFITSITRIMTAGDTGGEIVCCQALSPCAVVNTGGIIAEKNSCLKPTGTDQYLA